MPSSDKRSAYTRKLVSRSNSRFRVFVRKTNKNLYIALSDDITKSVLTEVSTLNLRQGKENCSNIACAEKLAALFVEKAGASCTEKAVFDRRKYKYHGAVKSIAESLRKHQLIA